MFEKEKFGSSLLLAAIFACLAGSFFTLHANAGGVRFVAGVSGFDPNAAGRPIIWANGAIVYFTDQGDAGPMLPQATANAFVADALSRWTSVSTAALSVTRGGALAEDVNGANVTNTANGISLPTDIQPSATSKPLAFVYDNDGQVIDALLGVGASDPTLCAANSVVGGVDRFSVDAHIIHALIVINGRCAQTSADLPAMKYRLIRILGQTLGLDWSQANDNVRSGSPFPSAEDYAGFPLMHPTEPFCGSAITNCIANADQLRMDDRAAISRLYPVSTQNISSFSGKQLFAENTIRIRGSIYFPDVRGNPSQPMQGVNVVARLIDPNTGQPSRRYVASSVSGFLFRGLAGNHVSGFGVNQRFDAFGSGDAALEGFYDLAGLELPSGQSTATYQITVEAVNALYVGEFSVGPYASGSVVPSGTAGVITLSGLAPGADVTRDIIMQTSARLPVDITEPNSFFTPSPVPLSGQWWGSLSGYGDEDFFTFAAHANRSFSLQVTALNEKLAPTSGKAQPELGFWSFSEPTTPQVTANTFNGSSLGLTELAATISATGRYKLGIADARGDGRPDFLYRARLLYADTLTPARIKAGGVPLSIRGIGFRRGMNVTIGAVSATVAALDENQIVVSTPVLSSGLQDIVVTDPATGASSTMSGAITYGLLSDDRPVNVSTPNNQVAVGSDAPNPITIRVVAPDGLTRLANVDVAFSVSPLQSQFRACGSNVCTLTTDGNGEVSATLSVKSAGSNLVSATLSNGNHVEATVVGTSLVTLSPLKQVTVLPIGSTTSVPLSVRLLSGGAPIGGQQVTFNLISGAGSLANTSLTTASDGIAATTLQVTNLSATVNVTACVNAVPCTTFSVFTIQPANIKLQKIGGDDQLLLSGQTVQPLVLRVTDSSTPPNLLAGIPVALVGTIFTQPGQPDCSPSEGVCRPATTNFVSRFSATLTSDANGMVSFTPTIQAGWGSVQMVAIAKAGSGAVQSFGVQIIALQ